MEQTTYDDVFHAALNLLSSKNYFLHLVLIVVFVYGLWMGILSVGDSVSY